MTGLSSRRHGGFTLIELMIVVAIIGILAAIAIPNFVRFQLRSKSSEGKTNLAGIRTSEESYFAANNGYITAAISPAMLAAPASRKQNFVDAGAAGANFNTIGWAPEGQVYFRYAVNSMGADYTADAQADIDANGVNQLWGYARTSNGMAPTLAGLLLCPGVWDTVTSMANLPNQVGPCDGTSGRSTF
ncbi:MAG: prepilin-type N-terminal cleavage/methylation domain-containing protein [Deltaproteobacteria bacterium]|nr:prepilin-type N-terminal cleavage/methylation domain-containing protein [Deltaproteobacteria bacterium]